MSNTSQHIHAEPTNLGQNASAKNNSDIEMISHATSPHPVELLAPAGGKLAFRAALAAGADAIYFGTEDFNARRNAENIQREDLAEVARLAHLSGARVYLTANIVIKESEVDQLLSLVKEAWEAGIDGIIVQDWGMLAEIARAYPEIEIHVSTQANVHDNAGVDFARELGAKRVTVSRELSLGELAELASRDIDIEVFSHGALCISYSGLCLMSSLIGGRSANRGLCAQPCRMEYTLVDTDDNDLGRVEGSHLLSPKDLSTIDILPELIGTGITSLKLEGRMKSPEYVSTVVSTYRNAVDRALANADNYSAAQAETNQLTEAFSRGFTTAYLEGERGNAMMSYGRPNNRGIMVGRVSKARGEKITIDLTTAVKKGDLLELWTSRGHLTTTVEQPAKANQSTTISVQGAVSPGDRVFRVRSAKIAKQTREATEHQVVRERPVLVTVNAHLGSPLHIEVSDEHGNYGQAFGLPVEAARTKEITREQIVEHVGRFGGTAFEPAYWEINLDEGIGMGFSQLHRVRAEAVQALEDDILEQWSSRALEHSGEKPVARSIKEASRERAEAEKRALTPASYERGYEVVVMASTPNQVEAAFQAGADRVMVNGASVREHEELSRRDVDVVLGAVSRNADKRWQDVAQHKDRIVIANMSQATLEAPHKDAWYTIPGLNPSTLGLLAELNVERAWLSPELTLTEIESLARRSPVALGISVLGSQELMTLEHCVLMSMGPCSLKCEICPRRKSAKFLRDRKGYKFPVRTDSQGKCHIYNGVPLDITDQIPRLMKAGVTSFMVDATLMEPSQIADEVSRVHAAGEAVLLGKRAPERKEGTTSGHLFRGIL